MNNLEILINNLRIDAQKLSALTRVDIKVIEELLLVDKETNDEIDSLINKTLLKKNGSGTVSYIEIKSAVKKLFKNQNIFKIYLFGSYVLGKANEKSDIDILIVDNTFGKGIIDIKNTIKLNKELNKNVDISYLSPMVNNQLTKVVSKHGLLIYEKELF